MGVLRLRGAVELRLLLITIGGFVAALVLGALAIDEGEVVSLRTFDAEGRDSPTQLWIVDLDGQSFLRAGSPDRAWLERLRARPEAFLERGEDDRPVTATPVADALVLARVNHAMAEKYGLSDRLASVWLDRTRSVPVRIEPRPVDGTAVSEHRPPD